MSNWRNIEIGKVIDFNPSESIKKGAIAKKIPMDKLTAYEKKIKGFEVSEYSAGPKFRNGDTLVAKITPCLENGKTAQVDILDENEVAFGSSEFIVLRENEHTINDYIFYLAKSPAFRKRAISCMEGTSGRKRVNEGALKLQVLPIPDKITQQKIAKVLSDLDAKIELNNKINNELEAMAKTLYDYWFVQFDFPDATGKPYKTSDGKMVWNDELNRNIPEGWKVNTIGDYCKSTGGFAFKSSWWSNNGLKVVKIKDIQEDNTISLNNLSYADISSEKIDDKFIAKPGNVLIAMTGATVGKFGIVPYTDDPLYVNQRVGYFGLGKNPIEKLPFLINSLNQKYFRESIFTLASGAAQPNISNDQINNIPLLSPQLDLVDNFNTILTSNYSKILNNLKENQELASLRDWLLPMLMNGQVSVGEVEKDYVVKDEVFGMVAEPNKANNFKEIINQLNFDYEIAAIASLTFQKFKRPYGKKYIHKMFSNIELLNTLPAFKKLVFEEKGWGMFSPQIKKAIDDQKFIQFEEINDTQKVIKLNMKHLIEVSTWMKQEENKEFITQVNNMLTIYENPIINKKMDNIELFNTVLECIKVLKTYDFKAIYTKMQNWPMEEEGYATKADKFAETATQHMISFIKEIKN